MMIVVNPNHNFTTHVNEEDMGVDVEDGADRPTKMVLIDLQRWCRSTHKDGAARPTKRTASLKVKKDTFEKHKPLLGSPNRKSRAVDQYIQRSTRTCTNFLVNQGAPRCAEECGAKRFWLVVVRTAYTAIAGHRYSNRRTTV